MATNRLSILLNIINNHAADVLTCRVELAIKKSKLIENTIIICMHNVAIEKKAIDIRAFQACRVNIKFFALNNKHFALNEELLVSNKNFFALNAKSLAQKDKSLASIEKPFTLTKKNFAPKDELLAPIIELFIPFEEPFASNKNLSAPNNKLFTSNNNNNPVGKPELLDITLLLYKTYHQA